MYYINYNNDDGYMAYVLNNVVTRDPDKDGPITIHEIFQSLVHLFICSFSHRYTTPSTHPEDDECPVIGHGNPYAANVV